MEAWKFDGPWFSDGLSDLAAWRRRRAASDTEPPFRLMEIETTAGVHVGWVTSYVRKDDPHMTEVGIDIVEESLWNKGLGTEALALWVDYQFRCRGLHRIGLSTWSGNPRMIRVAGKLGFKEEGRIRDGCEVGGRFYDRLKFGILAAEWQMPGAGQRPPGPYDAQP